MRIFSINRKPSRTGYTIIELLVAMTVFMMLISVTSGIFIRALRTQRMTTALIAANSNAGLAIEQISREIRTGTGFVTNGISLTFNNAKNQSVTYRWNNVSSALAIERSIDGINFKRITADNVRIHNLNFTVFRGPSQANPYPARITIVLQVGALTQFPDAPLVNLQTTVSARVLE